MRGSWVILALNSGNANRSVSLLPPTTKVINMPYQHKTIKTPIQKRKRFVKVEELIQLGKPHAKSRLLPVGFSLLKRSRAFDFAVLRAQRKTLYMRM